MNNKKRYLFFWLYTIFAVGIPVILIAEVYGFLEKNTSAYTYGAGLIIIAVLLLFYFRKHLGKYVDNMESSLTKHFIIATRELMPLIIIYLAFAFTYLQFESITFILKWSCLSNAIALGFRALHLRELDLITHEGSE